MVTLMGNFSISLAQRVLIPTWLAARGKPPIPSNKLPMVRLISHLLVPLAMDAGSKVTAFAKCSVRVASGGSPPASLPEHLRFKVRELHLQKIPLIAAPI